MVEEPGEGASEPCRIPGLDEDPRVVQDLGDHRDPRRDDGTAERHGVEDLGRHLAEGIGADSLWSDNHVGGGQIERHVGEGDLRDQPHASPEGSEATAGGAVRSATDHRKNHIGPGEDSYRFGEIINALVGAGRSQKHNDALRPDPQARPPRLGTVAFRPPLVGVPDVGNEHPAEALLEEPRGHCDGLGPAGQALHEPDPRKAVGIGEVQKAPEPSPRAGAVEEAHLPVVDVEDQRAPPLPARQETDAVARGPGLGGVEEVTVGQPEERWNCSDEGRISRSGNGPVLHAAVPDGSPDVALEPRPHHLDVVFGAKKASQEVSPPRRVVRAVEAEDGDLHSASPRRTAV